MKLFSSQATNTDSIRKFDELHSPSLFDSETTFSPCLNADYDIENDVEYLLEISLLAHDLGLSSSWQDVLPIYPTSPVGVV